MCYHSRYSVIHDLLFFKLHAKYCSRIYLPSFSPKKKIIIIIIEWERIYLPSLDNFTMGRIPLCLWRNMQLYAWLSEWIVHKPSSFGYFFSNWQTSINFNINSLVGILFGLLAPCSKDTIVFVYILHDHCALFVVNFCPPFLHFFILLLCSGMSRNPKKPIRSTKPNWTDWLV